MRNVAGILVVGAGLLALGATQVGCVSSAVQGDSSEMPNMDEALKKIVNQGADLCASIQAKLAKHYSDKMLDRKDLASSYFWQNCGALFQTNVGDCVEESQAIQAEIPVSLSVSEKVDLLNEIQRRKKQCAEEVPVKTASQMVFQIEYSIHLRKNLPQTSEAIVADPDRFTKFLEYRLKYGAKGRTMI